MRQLHPGAQWHLHEVRHLRQHHGVQLIGDLPAREQRDLRSARAGLTFKADRQSQ